MGLGVGSPMKIIWQISPEDVARVRAFFSRDKEADLVKERVQLNLSDRKRLVRKSAVWEKMVCCLLTSQQPSSPGKPVARFVAKRPFPLRLRVCLKQPKLATFATKVLATHGGIRFSTIIGKRLADNIRYLEYEGGWKSLMKHIEDVRLYPSLNSERQAAEFIDENLKGFGPKQSRNLLQWLGLSRYEIPLDSRVTKWLNEFGFPVTLVASLLQNQDYYQFVSDGFQQLCRRCRIKPCVLDAAIFTHYNAKSP